MKRLVLCSECGGEREHCAKGMCKKCYRHSYYMAHREKFLVRAKRYRARVDPEKRRAYHRQYYATHLEQMRATNKHKRYRANKTCPDCGIQISDRAAYCRSCAKIGKRNPSFGKIYGSNNPCWKGGRTKCGGYVHILKQEHPYANMRGYVLEHRLIVERAIGRYLKSDEFVHHINGVKDDNRLENLELVDQHRRQICPQCGWPMNNLLLARDESP